LIAGLTDLPLDELARREAQRRIRRLTLVSAASVGAAVLTGGLAIYANQQRIEADRQRAQAEAARHVAERETAAARAAADFLVSTFTIGNPATENPRTITALTILARSVERARRARNAAGNPVAAGEHHHAGLPEPEAVDGGARRQ
jgi:hypothetical protein